MPNSMLKNNTQTQFLQFARDLKQTGKDPKAILNELVSSGKVSQSQLDEATRKARQYEWLLQLIK